MHEPERQWVTSRYRTVKADCAIVVIHTDEGLQGIGEAYSVGPDLATVAAIDDFATWLVGEDPTNIEHLWAKMYLTDDDCPFERGRH